MEPDPVSKYRVHHEAVAGAEAAMKFASDRLYSDPEKAARCSHIAVCFRCADGVKVKK
jgi:hypothetical protein